MKDFKEKMEQSEKLRPLTPEEMKRWEKAYLKYQADMAKQNGISSYLPIVFISELGELIKVISDQIARPDRETTKWDILDEISDVYGYLHYMMTFYDISMEEVMKASTLKIANGAINFGIPLPDALTPKQKDGILLKEYAKSIEELWDSYLEVLGYVYVKKNENNQK